MYTERTVVNIYKRLFTTLVTLQAMSNYFLFREPVHHRKTVLYAIFIKRGMHHSEEEQWG